MEGVFCAVQCNGLVAHWRSKEKSTCRPWIWLFCHGGSSLRHLEYSLATPDSNNTHTGFIETIDDMKSTC